MTGSVSEVGFKWGTTSGNLNNTTTALLSGTSFSANLTGLESATKYYCQAYATIAGTGDKSLTEQTFYGDIRSFETLSCIPLNVAYISCMEIPSVSLSETSRSIGGTSSDDQWFSTPTLKQGQTLVSHSFSNGSDRNRSFSLLYDEDKRCALWVACAFNSTTFGNNSVGRNELWTYDPALSTSIQPNLSSAYKNDSDGSAYSRGHQVASGERQTTAAENQQTFYYTNMTPQNQTLNGGQWAQLESAVATLGNSCTGRDTLYVVTGPVFDAGYKSTTDKSGNVCAIPSRYYKALMLCSFDSYSSVTSAKAVAYLTTGNDASANTSYSSWITTVDAIEELTGFDLFCNLPDSKEAEAESQATSLF